MSQISAVLPGIRNRVPVPEEHQELAKTLDATGNQHDGVISLSDATGDADYNRQLGLVLDAARQRVFERAATASSLTNPERISQMQAKTAVRKRVKAALQQVFPEANPAPRVIEIGRSDDSHSRGLEGMDVAVRLPAQNRHGRDNQHQIFVANSDSEGTIALKIQLAFNKQPTAYTQWLEREDTQAVDRTYRDKAAYIIRALYKSGAESLPLKDWGRYHESKEPGKYSRNRFVDAVELDEETGRVTVRQPHGPGAGTTIMGFSEIYDRFTGEPTGVHAFMVRWTSADGSEIITTEMLRDAEGDYKFPPRWQSF